MFGRIRSLIIKEMLALWRDPKSRFVMIVPPLIQLAVFSYACTYDVKQASLALLNQDGGLAARELVARVAGAPAFADLVMVGTEDQLRDAIDSRRAMAGLRIPQDFSRKVEQGAGASVQVILDGRRSNSAQIVSGYLQTIIADHNAELAPATRVPTLVARSWFNPNLESIWVVVPGLVGVLTQVVALVVTALSVARERELGTFEQLLVTPLRPWEILVGKTMPALLIGLVESSLIIAVAGWWFQVPLTASLVLVYAAVVAFVASVIGVGLFISALCGTQQQAILGAFFFLVPTMILSGFATPVENMPDWLQVVTLANPVRHFLHLIWGLFLKGIGPAQAWDSIWPMLVIAAVTLTGSAFAFRRRLY